MTAPPDGTEDDAFDDSPRRASSLIPTGQTPLIRPGSLQSHFLELEVTNEGDAIQLRHARENTFGQLTAMGLSVFLFMLFVVSIMPRMHLSTLASTLWIVIGVAVLIVVALVAYAQMRSTTLRLDSVGISIEQGTALDHESIAIAWSDLAAVDLEPVDPKDGRRGMQLQLRPSVGEPVNTLAGVGLAELNEVRRIVAEALHDHERRRPRR